MDVDIKDMESRNEGIAERKHEDGVLKVFSQLW
jgi:hypothetical protein